MFRDTKAFSGFSVNDIDAARKFYGDILGLDVEQNDAGLELNIAGGTTIFAYGKDNHTPATFTILNFPVTDISDAVDTLKSRGVVFQRYEGELGTDERGIFWGKKQEMGPNIAWFTDPAGNILSVIEM
jgi:catechol 2,3-dioxygenase-like lactoylglutathione lyase family enzyme